MLQFFLEHWIEIFGYFGSILVAVSLMMRSIKYLRWINLIGAAIFSVYGLLVHALPVFILNGFIALVDIYYLLQMYRIRDYFELLTITNPDNRFLKRFLDFHRNDIRHFFPSFDFDIKASCQIIFILRNMMPVGLFIVEPKSEEECLIHLDYIIPSYRDLQNAHYLYNRQHELFQLCKGKYFIACSRVAAHVKYLKDVGFEPFPKRGADCFRMKKI